MCWTHMVSIAEKVSRAVSSHLTVRIDLLPPHGHSQVSRSPLCSLDLGPFHCLRLPWNVHPLRWVFFPCACVRLSLLLCGESIQCPRGFWGFCGDRGVPVTVLTLVGGSRTFCRFWYSGNVYLL